MQKTNLLNFISRYHLGGNCEAVKINMDATGVHCELIDEDQTVVGKVNWKTTPFANGEIGINHTGGLVKMLSAVGDNIDINVRDSQGKNYAMEIKEGSTKLTFMLADTSVIPNVPTINQEPAYEVEIAIEASKKLQQEKIYSKVISVPCQELFELQNKKYKQKILGETKVKISLEAASTLGWKKLTGNEGMEIGINSFGKSAPYKKIYEHFQITSNNVIQQAKKLIKK